MKNIRKIPFSTLLPMLLLAGLCLFMLVFVFLQAKHYGLTIDEQDENNYGHVVLAWYKTLGKDTSFLSFGALGYVPEHGSIFEVTVALAQHFFGHEWYTRAVMTGLVGVTGVIAIGLCGYELAGWWGAFLAALALWLYPRHLGAIFNNPKDIPFAVAMTWILWSVIGLVKRWESGQGYRRQSIVVGFFIGLAASIRITAIMWFLVLALLIGFWFLSHVLELQRSKSLISALLKQSTAVLIISITTFLTVITLWPYILLNPIHNLHTAIVYMSAYPWYGPVLFNGVAYPAQKLPWYYVPEWLAIGSPPTLVVFSLVGLLIAGLPALKKSILEPPVAVILFGFFVPFSAFVLLHPSIYDTLRLFLFLIPPMILLAVYGGVQVFRYLIAHKHKAIALVLVLLTIFSYVLVIQRMVELHPYEYTYFSPIVGPLTVANQEFPVDYWGTCEREAGEWVAQNYQHYTNKPHPTMISIHSWEFLSKTFLPPNFQIDEQNPDFYILFYHDVAGPAEFSKFPSYKIVHTVSRDNTTLCIVKANPNLRK